MRTRQVSGICVHNGPGAIESIADAQKLFRRRSTILRKFRWLSQVLRGAFSEVLEDVQELSFGFPNKFTRADQSKVFKHFYKRIDSICFYRHGPTQTFLQSRNFHSPK
ncbi:hypothetical protein VTL71DRAFT_11585 [Oculimacula yallundae]|uniref:Uncharacterized protein n=1 Tax=Oculimacula yallundae TaxID=86028 RepID=A0ABR4CRP5_9HELO